MASLTHRRLITLSIDGKEREEILQDGASCGIFILLVKLMKENVISGTKGSVTQCDGT